jgi:spore maturation protein CgeB
VAPWGNHVLTYRFFEGLAQRCLVVAQSLRATEFLDGGLEPGRHYVEVAADLGDLTEKVGFYLDNEREAQRIADAGHEHFTRHFASRGPLVSSYIFDATVESWGEFYRPATPSGISSALRSAAARIWTKAF